MGKEPIEIDWEELRGALLVALRGRSTSPDLEDAVHDAMVSLMIARNCKDIRNPFGFCLAVAGARLVDIWRSQCARLEPLGYCPDPVAKDRSLELVVLAFDVRPMVVECLVRAGLSQPDADLLAGRWFGGLDWRSAAGACGFPLAALSAAKRRIQRFLSRDEVVKRLRVVMESEIRDPSEWC